MNLLGDQRKRQRQEARARRRTIQQQGFVSRGAEGFRYSYFEKALPRSTSSEEQEPTKNLVDTFSRLIFRKEQAEIDRWNESNGANHVSREIARGAMMRTLGWGATMAASVGVLFMSGSESFTNTQRAVLFTAGIGGTMLGGAKTSVNTCMNVTATLAKDLDTTAVDFQANIDGFKISSKPGPAQVQGDQV